MLRWSAAPFLSAFFLSFFLAPPDAGAHDESLSTSDVVVDGQTMTWRVEVGLGGLAKAVELPAREADLTAADLLAAKDLIGAALSAGLTVTINGRPVAAQLGALIPGYEPHVTGGKPDLARAAQVLVFRSQDPIAAVNAQVRFFSGLTSQHRSLIVVKWGGQIRQFVRTGPTDIAFGAGTLIPSTGSVVWELFQWGMHHIFRGYDHIAFLLALLLAVTTFKGLISIVTAFTVAHSVTLLLAALELIRIPVRVTELLIAGSILYVTAENLGRSTSGSRRRWLVTFIFGLIHGAGFATEIRDRLAELSGSVVLPVISFNLGIEAGQMVIVALIYPLLVRLRRAPTEALRTARQRRIMIVGSIPLLLAGLYWLVDRLSV